MHLAYSVVNKSRVMTRVQYFGSDVAVAMSDISKVCSGTPSIFLLLYRDK